MANDGTVKIGTDIDESGFKSGLSKLGGVAKTALKGTVAAIGGVATAATGAVTGLLALESATEEYRVAQGKLNTAFEAAGYGPETASKAYSDFYKILGDTDTATEASQLLAQLAENEEDVSTWTDIAAGVFGTFGDSLPIEGLIESANETAKVGQVTGTLADALNWAGISEDKFNEKLAKCTSESERNQLIMSTLSRTYDQASAAFYRNNEALIQARENQILLDDTLSQLGETVSKVKNNLLSEFLPSIASVVTAFNDLVNGVDGADEALSTAIGDMVTALVEKPPDFLSFGVDVLQAILQGIIDNLPTLLDGLAQVVEEIFVALVELAPSLLDAGIELLKYIADGIKNGIPSLVEKLPEIISSISEYFTENLPSILDTGADILISLIDGIVSAIPILMENLPQILTSIIDFIVENLPEIIGTGVEILTALVYGIISAIPSIVLALPDVVKAILDGFAQLPQMLFDIGANIIQGLIDGFLSMVGNVVDAIGSVIDAIFGTAEKEAEVHSPSKRGERLGKNIDQGIANGLEGNAASVKSAVSRLDVLSELERAMPNIERRVTLVNDGMVPGSVAATTVRETADTNKSGEVYGNSSQRVKLDIGFYPREASMFLRPYLRDEDRRSGTDLVE
nr:MAG TPA: minor tail protein [Caudoviricetes sp.]